MPIESDRGHGARFPDTSWGLVLASSPHGDTRGRDAFASLCRDYWLPIYASLRRQGLTASDAEDLAQGFFLHLIDGGAVARADPERGRFRNFLRGALTRFLASETEREAALKRGGSRTFVSFDAASAEAQLAVGYEGISQEFQFDRQWARAIVANALAQLAAEYAASGEAVLFAALEPSLSGRGIASYADVGARLGRSEGAIKTAIHRLRRRFREVLREEVAQTVAQPDEIDDELRYLRNVLASESETTMT